MSYLLLCMHVIFAFFGILKLIGPQMVKRKLACSAAVAIATLHHCYSVLFPMC